MRVLILRRVGLLETGAGGPIIVGRADSADVLRLQGFLRHNGHPHQLLNPGTDDEAKALIERFHIDPGQLPIVLCPGGQMLRNPSEQELARCVGLVRPIDPKRHHSDDLASNRSTSLISARRIAWAQPAGRCFDTSSCPARRITRGPSHDEAQRIAAQHRQAAGAIAGDLRCAAVDQSRPQKADFLPPSPVVGSMAPVVYGYGNNDHASSGFDHLLPRMKFCISSRVTVPSLSASIALKMRS
jgi:hypothetical protein